MNFRRTHRPWLEQLEDRTCPALTLKLLPGTLYITGAPRGTLTIQETGANAFQVQDGVTPIATFTNISNITIQQPNRPADLNIALNATGLSGNLLMDLGFGDTNGPPSTIHISGGTIRGSVTLLKGSGDETYDLGFNSVGATDPLTVRGNVNVVARTSGGTGGGAPRDTLFLQTGSAILGSLTTTNVDSMLLAPGTSLGRNLTVNNVLEHTTPDAFLLGTIGRDVSVNGPVTGLFFALGFGAPGSGVVGGSLSVNSLGGSNFVTLNPNSVVSGNARINTGFGTDFISLQGEVDSNVFVSTGEGDDFVNFDPAAVVAGSMRINGGNGNNTVVSSGLVNGDLSFYFGNGNDTITVDGQVSGNLLFNMGNGDNTVNVTQAPGHTLYWISGNGNNSLTLGSAATPPNSLWNVYVRFGNGDDTFTLDGTAPPTQTLNGFVDGGGQITADVFNQGASWVLAPTLVVTNFP
jgi:hypothetical protein